MCNGYKNKYVVFMFLWWLLDDILYNMLNLYDLEYGLSINFVYSIYSLDRFVYSLIHIAIYYSHYFCTFSSFSISEKDQDKVNSKYSVLKFLWLQLTKRIYVYICNRPVTKLLN